MVDGIDETGELAELDWRIVCKLLAFKALDPPVSLSLDLLEYNKFVHIS